MTIAEIQEQLIEVRKVTKDIFELVCLLANHNLRDFHLIADRTDQIRKSYPFLGPDVIIAKIVKKRIEELQNGMFTRD